MRGGWDGTCVLRRSFLCLSRGTRILTCGLIFTIAAEPIDRHSFLWMTGAAKEGFPMVHTTGTRRGHPQQTFALLRIATPLRRPSFVGGGPEGLPDAGHGREGGDEAASEEGVCHPEALDFFLKSHGSLRKDRIGQIWQFLIFVEWSY